MPTCVAAGSRIVRGARHAAPLGIMAPSRAVDHSYSARSLKRYVADHAAAFSLTPSLPPANESRM